jgi:hypothetical protein
MVVTCRDLLRIINMNETRSNTCYVAVPTHLFDQFLETKNDFADVRNCDFEG